MKLLTFALILLGTLGSMAEDMRVYLRQTQSLVQRGQHQQALERMIWFHENAVRQDPSMYATRLTTALDAWKRLADFYKPAHQALVSTRDRAEARVLSRGGSRQLFADAVAINRVLEEPERSLQMFRTLHLDRPRLARQYWPLARDVVLTHGAPHLAGEYIRDPMAEFESSKKTYQRLAKLGAKRQGANPEILRQRQEQFVVEARQLAEVAVVKGDSEAAIQIQKATLELVDDPALQSLLTSGLPKVPEPLPPAEDPLPPAE